MDEQQSLIHAFELDGNGGAVDTAPGELQQITGPAWLHFDFTSADSRQWVRNESGIPPVITDALLDEDSRPRVLEYGDGVLVIVRGVNHNPGEELDDMVSIRLWITPNRIVSTRRRRLLSVKGIADDLRAGNGPNTLAGLVISLVDRLNERIDAVVDTLNDSIEQAEVQFADDNASDYRGEFSQLRRRSVRIRRWLAPQRAALEALSRSAGPFFTDNEKLVVREQADQLIRFLEELDLVRERAMVAQEELIAHLAQEQNTRMYILSLIAAIFLPLSFITGLLGMNVAGLPGTEDPRAFMLLLGAMLAGGVGIVLLFRWRRWL